MRRMVKEAAFTQTGLGGVPSTGRDSPRSAVKDSEVASSATAERCTGVTWRTVFRETASRSAVKQFV